MIDADLMRVALAVAACIFILGEVMRLSTKGSILEASLSHFVNGFRSGLDQGEAVLSHLFLLLGCAIPIWIDDSPLPALSGVLSLGLADAMVHPARFAFLLLLNRQHWLDAGLVGLAGQEAPRRRSREVWRE